MVSLRLLTVGISGQAEMARLVLVAVVARCNTGFRFVLTYIRKPNEAHREVVAESDAGAFQKGSRCEYSV